MTVEWDEAARAWRITQPFEAVIRLPKIVLRHDRARGCYWVPELAWSLLEKALGPEHGALFLRYHVHGDTSPVRVAKTSRPLLPHQIPAVSHLLRLGRAGLFDDMGLCKTSSVIAAYNTLRHTVPNLQLLVLAPKRVLPEWQSEVRLTLGRDPEPREQFCNYDKVFREKYALGLLGFVAAAPTVLVLDECHTASGIDSKRFQAVEQLARRATYLWALSGTPVRNRPESFFPVYKLISNAAVTYEQFLALYCTTVMGRITGYRNLERLEAVTRQYCIRREAQNVLTLPPLTEQRILVELEGPQAALYQRLKTELRSRVRTMQDDEYTGQATDLRAQVNALLMAASHPSLVDADAGDEGCAKLALIDEILAESGTQKVLIWSRYPRVLERIRARSERHGARAVTLHGANSDKVNEANKKQFLTDPDTKVACLSLGAMGEGLNLQCATIAVYHDLFWTFDKFHQSQRRLWRTGQTKPVHIYYLLAKGTVEEYVMQTLNDKKDYQQAITGDGQRWSRQELLRVLK